MGEPARKRRSLNLSLFNNNSSESLTSKTCSYAPPRSPLKTADADRLRHRRSRSSLSKPWTLDEQERIQRLSKGVTEADKKLQAKLLEFARQDNAKLIQSLDIAEPPAPSSSTKLINLLDLRRSSVKSQRTTTYNDFGFPSPPRSPSSSETSTPSLSSDSHFLVRSNSIGKTVNRTVRKILAPSTVMSIVPPRAYASSSVKSVPSSPSAGGIVMSLDDISRLVAPSTPTPPSPPPTATQEGDSQCVKSFLHERTKSFELPDDGNVVYSMESSKKVKGIFVDFSVPQKREPFNVRQKILHILQLFLSAIIIVMELTLLSLAVLFASIGDVLITPIKWSFSSSSDSIENTKRAAKKRIRQRLGNKASRSSQIT